MCIIITCPKCCSTVSPKWLAANVSSPNEISLTLHPSRKDLEARIQCMDEAGITVSILTGPGAGDGRRSRARSERRHRRSRTKHPRRFRGCIHLPSSRTPKPPSASSNGASTRLGLRAVALLACHLDVQLDNPVMNPLFETIQKNNLPIVIHPQSKPTGSDTPVQLQTAACFRPVGNHAGDRARHEQRLAALSRAALHHAAPGRRHALRSKGRMDGFLETEDADIPHGHERLPKNSGGAKRFGLTGDALKNFFSASISDTAGTGAWLPAMAAAFNITTADRIMFGSDYPLECKTAANLTESLNMIRQASCSDTDKTGDPRQELPRVCSSCKTIAGLDHHENDLLTIIAVIGFTHRYRQSGAAEAPKADRARLDQIQKILSPDVPRSIVLGRDFATGAQPTGDASRQSAPPAAFMRS